MMSFVRRLSKSAVGTAIMILFLLTIAASFAMQDVRNLSPFSGGMSGQTIAKAGNRELTDQELSKELQNRLAEARRENPMADYSSIAADFDPLVDALIQQKALLAFANANEVVISKRLIDAEIAKLPQAQGLNGRFSQDAYYRFLAQARMSDAEVRDEIQRSILNRVMLAPAAAGARVPVGVARPYAEMQLEVREADVALIPTQPFLKLVGSPSDQQLQAYYKANLARYAVPEQRVLDIAKIGPENVANVTPSDKDISDYYASNQSTYSAKVQRVISQVVLPSKQAADQLAAKIRSGTPFADAAKPLGFSNADISVGPQTKEQFAGLTNPAVANATFADNVGANSVVGPLRSDLGYHVIKIDGITSQGGKTLAQARGEIIAKLTVDKRKEALADLIGRLEDEVADGKNFAEATAAVGIKPIRTPVITAGGVARAQPGFKLPAELAPALRSGFELAQGDEPVVETLPGEAGYVLVGVDFDHRIRSCSPRRRARATVSGLAAQAGQRPCQGHRQCGRGQGRQRTGTSRRNRRRQCWNIPPAAGEHQGSPDSAQPNGRQGSAGARHDVQPGRRAQPDGCRPGGSRLHHRQGNEDRPRRCHPATEPRCSVAE